MTDTYDITPKIPILEYGALIKTKCELICTKDSHPDEGYDPVAEKEHSKAVEEALKNNQPPPAPAKQFMPETIEIPANSILFYVQDAQFMSMSKVERKTMSAWIRVNFVTGDKQKLWTTVVCSPQRIWDFETYRGKKKTIKALFDEMFEVISTGE